MTRKIDAKQAKLDRYWAKCDEDGGGGEGREGNGAQRFQTRTPKALATATLSGAVADDDGDAFPHSLTDSVAATLERAQ